MRGAITFRALVSDLTLKLAQLRSIIYSIKWVECAAPSIVWDEKRIQSMMQLFLNYTFNACSDVMVATAAQGDKIEFTRINQDQQEVTW